MKKYLCVLLLFCCGCADYEIGDLVRLKDRRDLPPMRVVQEHYEVSGAKLITTIRWHNNDRIAETWCAAELERLPADSVLKEEKIVEKYLKE